jgi:uncharacterized protein (DUF1330 family)
LGFGSFAQFNATGGSNVSKAYWVVCYREINDPAKLAAYGKLAGPAVEAAGGHFLARANAVHAYEAGQRERTVIVEFESVEKATACHDSASYQAALKALDGGAIRDMRIVPGV